TSGEKRVFLVILFTSFSGSFVSRIPGAVHFSFINNPVVGNSTAIFELFCFVISVSVAAIYLTFIF
ncbi:TPA: hypothetical protein ACIYOR_005670, partial [Escherichia coli]